MDERTLIYGGDVVDLGIESCELPDGRRCALEIVRHPGGSAIVAADGQQRICLLRQYRHAAAGWLWELPAGKCARGEDPLRTAQRELEEEAGLRAATWRKLGKILTTPGFCDEVIHLYWAQDLTLVAPRPESDELFECRWVPYSQALEWTRDGTLIDAKSIIGIYLASSLSKTFL
jgi:ADP-ribose pyrophosphatase